VVLTFELAGPDGDGAASSPVLQARMLSRGRHRRSISAVRLTVASCIRWSSQVGAVLGTEDPGGDSAR
jgi:hypothetical protein